MLYVTACLVNFVLTLLSLCSDSLCRAALSRASALSRSASAAALNAMDVSEAELAAAHDAGAAAGAAGGAFGFIEGSTPGKQAVNAGSSAAFGAPQSPAAPQTNPVATPSTALFGGYAAAQAAMAAGAPQAPVLATASTPAPVPAIAAPARAAALVPGTARASPPTVPLQSFTAHGVRSKKLPVAARPRSNSTAGIDAAFGGAPLEGAHADMAGFLLGHGGGGAGGSGRSKKLSGQKGWNKVPLPKMPKEGPKVDVTVDPKGVLQEAWVKELIPVRSMQPNCGGPIKKAVLAAINADPPPPLAIQERLRHIIVPEGGYKSNSAGPTKRNAIITLKEFLDSHGVLEATVDKKAAQLKRRLQELESRKGGAFGGATPGEVAATASAAVLGVEPAAVEHERSKVPREVQITCNGTKALFRSMTCDVVCWCGECNGRRPFMTPSAFEKHVGCAAKKWKISFRVRDRTAPEGSLTLGDWLTKQGVDDTLFINVTGVTVASQVYKGPLSRSLLSGPEGKTWGTYESNAQTVPGTWIGDRCGVCGHVEDHEQNKLLTCDMCGATAHQHCYGKSASVQSQKDCGWLCRACSYQSARESAASAAAERLAAMDLSQQEALIAKRGNVAKLVLGQVDPKGKGKSRPPKRVKGSLPDSRQRAKLLALSKPPPPPRCALCPVEGGVLKPTTVRDVWAHPLCALWVPETVVVDPEEVEPIDRLQYVHRDRWALKCVVCNRRHGACIQCHAPNCFRSYHASCAFLAGLPMEVKNICKPKPPKTMSAVVNAAAAVQVLVPLGEAAVGRQLEIYFDGDATWYTAKILMAKPQDLIWMVQYEADGVKEVLNATKAESVEFPPLKLVPLPGELDPAAAGDGAADSGAAAVEAGAAPMAMDELQPDAGGGLARSAEAAAAQRQQAEASGAGSRADGATPMDIDVSMAALPSAQAQEAQAPSAEARAPDMVGDGSRSQQAESGGAPAAPLTGAANGGAAEQTASADGANRPPQRPKIKSVYGDASNPIAGYRGQLGQSVFGDSSNPITISRPPRRYHCDACSRGRHTAHERRDPKCRRYDPLLVASGGVQPPNSTKTPAELVAAAAAAVESFKQRAVKLVPAGCEKESDEMEEYVELVSFCPKHAHLGTVPEGGMASGGIVSFGGAGGAQAVGGSALLSRAAEAAQHTLRAIAEGNLAEAKAKLVASVDAAFLDTYPMEIEEQDSGCHAARCFPWGKRARNRARPWAGDERWQRQAAPYMVEGLGPHSMCERADVRAGISPRLAKVVARATEVTKAIGTRAPEVSWPEAGPLAHEEAGLLPSERLSRASEEEGRRVTFGKSAIHSWGMFAKRRIKRGEIVTEYMGELIRVAVANARERRYRAAQIDCYFFRCGEDQVIDATFKGGVGRQINASCDPNMYARILDSDSGRRVVFSALRDIEAGDECSYDYRFEEEEEDKKVPCYCGARTCRGTLN